MVYIKSVSLKLEAEIPFSPNGRNPQNVNIFLINNNIPVSHVVPAKMVTFTTNHLFTIRIVFNPQNAD